MLSKVFPFLITVLVSCTPSGGTTSPPATSTAEQSAAGTVKAAPAKVPGITYRENGAYLDGDAQWATGIRTGWPKKLGFPRYSRPLSLLARSLKPFGGKPADPGSLQKVASAFGIATPWISQTYMVALNYPDSSFVTWLRNTLAMYAGRKKVSHYGFAVVDGAKDGEKVGILLFQKRKIVLDPFGQVVPVGTPLRISGKVGSDVKKLEMLMTIPSGTVKRRAIALQGTGIFAYAEKFCTSGARGHYSVELMGEDAQGPVVLALFPVACGTAAQLIHAKVTLKKPTVDMDPAKAARATFDLVNAFRKKGKLKPLRWNARLAAVSTAHSNEMCRMKAIYHLSPVTGAPDKRTKHAGIKTDLVAENVAVASSPESIVSSWVMSEGHRLNMVLKDGVNGAVGICKVLINKSVHYYATLMVTGKIR